MMYRYYDYGYGYPGHGGWDFLWMILCWIAIVAFILFVVRHARKHKGCCVLPGDRKTPLDIAKERYAKGEIGKKEFEEMKKDLSE